MQKASSLAKRNIYCTQRAICTSVVYKMEAQLLDEKKGAVYKTCIYLGKHTLNSRNVIACMVESMYLLKPFIFHLHDGAAWMNTRTKLMPNFTPERLKQIFNSLLECSGPLIYQIDTKLKKKQSLNIKEIMSSFTMDVISSCAYGLECHHLNEPHVEFKKYSQRITTTSCNNFYNFVKYVSPSVWKIMYAKRVPTEIETYLRNTIQGICNYRKTSGVSRNDFMQFFLELEEQDRSNWQNKLTIEQIATQANVFFLGGCETTATTLTFILHELAYNQNIQDRLRGEIRRVIEKYNGNLTYDGIMEMKYLDQVVYESLRKYPPIPFLKRICTKDYKVAKTDFTIKKGTTIIISLLGIHHDPNNFLNPEEFDPERFTKENKNSRPAFTFLPFGVGTRSCIGQLFGLIQAKTCISLLLNNYKFSPTSTGNYNIEFEPSCRVLTTKEPIRLNAVRLSENITRYY
ncbi:Cyp6a9 [Trypoxylus dichotomus]